MKKDLTKKIRGEEFLEESEKIANSAIKNERSKYQGVYPSVPNKIDFSYKKY